MAKADPRGLPEHAWGVEHQVRDGRGVVRDGALAKGDFGTSWYVPTCECEWRGEATLVEGYAIENALSHVRKSRVS